MFQICFYKIRQSGLLKDHYTDSHSDMPSGGCRLLPREMTQYRERPAPLPPKTKIKASFVHSCAYYLVIYFNKYVNIAGSNEINLMACVMM